MSSTGHDIRFYGQPEVGGVSNKGGVGGELGTFAQGMGKPL